MHKLCQPECFARFFRRNNQRSPSEGQLSEFTTLFNQFQRLQPTRIQNPTWAMLPTQVRNIAHVGLQKATLVAIVCPAAGTQEKRSCSFYNLYLRFFRTSVDKSIPKCCDTFRNAPNSVIAFRITSRSTVVIISSRLNELK